MNIVTVLGTSREASPFGNLPSLVQLYENRLGRHIHCVAGSSMLQAINTFIATAPNGDSVRVIPTHPVLQAAEGFELESEHITNSGHQRNRAMLSLAGESFVSIDDDAQPAFLDAAKFWERLPADVSGPTGESFELTPFFSSPVGSSNDYSGEGLFADSRRCLDELNEAVQPGSDHSASVRLAQCGIVGNRWYSRASAGYFARSPIREQAYRSKDAYLQSMKSGMAMLCVRQQSRADSPFFVSCCCAINAEELMPPFPPLGRSQDAVFGCLVKYMYPETRIAHLPYMVRHILVPPRPFTDVDFQEIGLGFGTMTRLVIQHLIETALPVEGETAIRRMGERVVELSQVTSSDWLNLTQELYLRNAANEIQQLEELLDHYNEKPSYWAEEVHDYIDLVTRRGPEIANVHPRELRQSHSFEDAGAFQRTFLRSYGELMTAWPEIWQAALELKESEWGPE